MLGKITEILDAFSLTRPDMSLGEIQQATGLPTSTVQRLVSRYGRAGTAGPDGDRIRVGVRMSYWAATALKDLDVLAVVNSALKEIRDKTGETACFFKVEQNYRVCVAVAETHHALRRTCTWARSFPCTSAPRRGVAGVESRPRRQILDAPLEPMTDFTVTSPEDLRGLIAQAKADGYAITAGEREDSASGLSAPVFDAQATSSVRSRSAGRRSACRMRVRGMGRPRGRLRRAGHEDDRRPSSALSAPRNLSEASCTPRANRWPTWLPLCQYSSPPHRRCSC